MAVEFVVYICVCVYVAFILFLVVIESNQFFLPPGTALL